MVCREIGSSYAAMSTTMYGRTQWLARQSLHTLKRLHGQALRFSERLRHMASRMVKEVKKHAKDYVAIYLRFEVDAVAYSMCTYDDGGEAQLEVLKLDCHSLQVYI